MDSISNSCDVLLAPESGAHRKGDYRDFHPIHPAQSHVYLLSILACIIYSVYTKAFKPVYTKAFRPVYSKAVKPVYTKAI